VEINKKKKKILKLGISSLEQFSEGFLICSV